MRVDFLEKYYRSGPRYTSYPTVLEWSEDFGVRDYEEELSHLKDDGVLSIYFHLPFCKRRCLFCGCHVIIDKNRVYIEKYLEYLKKEVELFGRLMGSGFEVNQIHWGGGTPNFLNEWELESLFEHMTRFFNIGEQCELAIELDPCYLSRGQVKLLRDLGFNRLSFGVQDFNIEVQKEVKRVQSFEMTRGLMEYCRGLGYESINLDFIYGLPKQDEKCFDETVSQILELEPDRIAMYSYGKVPWVKPNQKKIGDHFLPGVEEKLRIFMKARGRLMEEGGYQMIGLDHFAKEEDDLVKALRNQTLHRNFMGYTVNANEEQIGFGLSAIGYVGRSYIQNVKMLKDYYEILDCGDKLPIGRGKRLNEDDLRRKWVIQRLMCHYGLDYEDYLNRYGERFEGYFEDELRELEDFEEDGLLILKDRGLEVSDLGTIFLRNIAMVFDAYTDGSVKKERFSKTV